MFVTRKFGNVERNSHCDVLHFTPVKPVFHGACFGAVSAPTLYAPYAPKHAPWKTGFRVARLFLDCNGVFAIKAYIWHITFDLKQVALHFQKPLADRETVIHFKCISNITK